MGYLDQLLEKAKKEPLPLAEEAEQHLSQIQEVLDQEKILIPPLDILSVYQKLLPLTILASRKEQSNLSFEQQLQGARRHAVKLAILFGDDKEAINYLYRSQAQARDSRQLVHDACLFSFPINENWHVALWQGIIVNQKPSFYKDAIIRLMGFARKIENVVIEKRKEIIAEIKQEIMKRHEQRITQEYDEKSKHIKVEGKEAWINKKLKSKEKEIERRMEFQFEAEIRKELKLSSGKLSKEEMQQLVARKRRSTLVDHERRTLLRENIVREEKENLVNDFSAEDIHLENKQEYIQEQLRKAAGIIDTEVAHRAKNLLSIDTPIAAIRCYSRHILYARASEKPEAAEKFFAYGLQEEHFNTYLSLKPVDDASLIPDVTIDGSEINETYSKFILRKLNPADPIAAILGKLTSCCQTLDDAGAASAIHGITNPGGGFYVLCRKGELDAPEVILAQCWAWRGKDDAIVFDSLESKLSFRNRAEYCSMMVVFYTYLANELVTKHHVPRVLVGTGGETPEALGFIEPLVKSFSPYGVYSDATTQRLIADAVIPVIAVCQIFRHKSIRQSVLLESIEVSRSEIEAWCDYVSASKYLRNLKKEIDHHSSDDEEQNRTDKAPAHHSIYPLIGKSGFNQADLEKRVALTDQWIEFLKNLDSKLPWDESVTTQVKLFFEQGVNLNLQAHDIKSILHLACMKNQLEMMQWLLHQGAKLPRDILHVAAELAYPPIVNWLLHELKVDINTRDMYGQTALHRAAAAGQKEMMESLIAQGADIDAVDQDGRNILHLAAYYGHLNVAAWLVTDKRLNVNAVNNRGETALHYAILGSYSSKDNTEVVRWLAQHADISISNKTGTVLHASARAGRYDFIKELAEKGICDINAKDSLGETVLHLAAKDYRKKPEEVRWLIGQGADITLKNKQNKTPIYHLISNKMIDLVKWILEGRPDLMLQAFYYAAELNSLELAKWLVEEKGMDVNTRVNTDQTALHRAVNNRGELVARWLVEHGADINALDNDGKSALYLSSKNGQWEFVSWLVMERKADSSVHYDDGKTLVHVAAYARQWPLVRWLFENTKADVNAKDSIPEDRSKSLADQGHNTVLHIAGKDNQWDLVEWLILNKNADINSKNLKGQTILHIAALSKIWYLVERLIHERKAEIDSKESASVSLLYAAAKAGKFDLVKVLVEIKGIDPAACNQEEVPLVAEAGHWSVLQYLIAHGADINAVDVKNETAVYVAAKKSQWHEVRSLVEQGADVNIIPTYSAPLLHLAAKDKQIDLIKWLITEKRANAEIKDKDFPFIHKVAFLKQWDLLLWLVENGVNVNSVNQNNRPLLHNIIDYARDEDQLIDLMKLLVSHGADINAKGYEGNTALHLCWKKYKSKDKALHWLLENGADATIKNLKGNTVLHEMANEWQWPFLLRCLKEKKNFNVQDNDGRTILHLAAEQKIWAVMRELLAHDLDPAIPDHKGKTTLNYIQSGGQFDDRAERQAREEMRFLLQNVIEKNNVRLSEASGTLFHAENTQTSSALAIGQTPRKQ